jgi:hypothetical protein
MKVLTDTQVKDFHRDGFIIIRKNFSEEEISLLARASKEDRELDQSAVSRDDGKGQPVRLAAWNHPGDGMYGMFARCRRIVDAVEQLLEPALDLAAIGAEPLQELAEETFVLLHERDREMLDLDPLLTSAGGFGLCVLQRRLHALGELLRVHGHSFASGFAA